MPHPRKISKNAVDAKSFCMSLIELTSLCPLPPTTPHPTPPHPSPSPCIPTHYENTTPFGIPRKPVFPQFLHGFSMRNLGNIVGRGWGRLVVVVVVVVGGGGGGISGGARIRKLQMRIRKLKNCGIGNWNSETTACGFGSWKLGLGN